MKVTFYGGTGSVTGANFLLEHVDSDNKTIKILIDCGMLQGLETADTFNAEPFPYNPSEIDFLLITHGHIDHIGRIPKLVKEGFKGRIISTPPTKDISELLLEDTYEIMDSKARKNGILTIFDKSDIKKSLSLWETCEYHKDFSLGHGISIYLRDSGHILGSAMIQISDGKTKAVFTGDLGNSPSLLLNDTEVITDADYIVMESVYGDRNHESADERRRKLKEVMSDTINNKRCLIIPAFSLERTQMLLYEMNEFFEKGIFPQIPVFLDSPLAIKITKIYQRYSSYLNENIRQQIASGDDVFRFPRLKSTPLSQDSARINLTANPKIIIAGSGMSEGGRVVRHEKEHAGDRNATILLVGYQALGTLGRRLEDKAKKIMIHGEEVEVRAKVIKIEGYSSHKDSDHLVSFVEDAAELGKLKKVFAVMGEPKSASFLVQRLHNELGVEGVFPEYATTVELK